MNNKKYQKKKSVDYLKSISYQVEMLLGYVNDLLDLKHINQGRFHKKISNFNPKKDVFLFIVEMIR